MTETKIYFSRSLKHFKSCYKDKFKYISFTETGAYNFFRLFKACADNPIKDYKKYLEKIQKHIKGIYDVDCWKSVRMGRVNIGFVMPHIHKRNPHLGSILNIGVKPEFRSKGFGKIIHASGLELLKKMGAEKYIGSTGQSNYAMIKIFKINGCKKINSSKSGKALLQTL